MSGKWPGPRRIAAWFAQYWLPCAALLCGLIMAVVPVLRALDYPLSLVASPLLAVLATLYGLYGGGPRPPAWWRDLAMVAAAGALLVVPAVVASAMAGAVCEPLYGLRFWLLGPLSSGALSLVVARTIRAWLGRGWGLVLVFVWLLGGPALALAEFFWSPGVRFYGSVYGLYHGAVYDEAVFVEGPYLWLRLWNLVGALGLVACHHLRAAPNRRWHWAAGGLGVAWLTLGLLSPYLGFVNSAWRLDQALSGHLATAHFDVRYQPGGRAEAWAPLMAEDLEFRYAQVQAFYALPEGSARITAYVYESPAHKASLMGAGRTSIAKPWLGQLHIQAHGVGGRLLHHELAHVMLASRSGSWLAMPTGPLGLPRPGVLEGAAVAVERGEGLLTTHQWTRAMRESKLLPDMPAMMESLAFWGQSSGRAYTACGSFVRFLVEQRGPEPFARLYAGADFEAAYGSSLEALLEEWHAFLDQIELGEDDLALAEFVFARPPVFERLCPYAGGRCLERARSAAARGDAADVAALSARALRLTNAELTLAGQLIRTLLAVDRVEEADALLELTRRRHPEPGLVAGQSLQLLEADIRWLQNEPEKTRNALSELAGGAFARLAYPAVENRLALATQGAEHALVRLTIGATVRHALLTLLATVTEDESSLSATGRLQVVAVQSLLPAVHHEALDRIDEAMLAQLPAELLPYAHRLRLKLAVMTHDLATARSDLQWLETSAHSATDRERVSEWRERIEWLAESMGQGLP